VIDVLYRDTYLLAVSKPSGVLVHRGWARDGEVLVDEARRLTGLATVHPIHRLDRATSGVALLALDAEAARALAGQLERHEVEKRYVALVRGLAPEAALVDQPLPRREGGPRVEAATAIRRLGWVEAEPRRLSLVEAAPRTGRLHQVRRHLKHLGHPVIGDANYGNGPLNRAVRDRYGLARLALHAASLSVTHPVTGERLELAAPMPDDLRVPLERMGFEEMVAEVGDRLCGEKG
jgi:tRNA pseudouridine65 synthase